MIFTRKRRSVTGRRTAAGPPTIVQVATLKELAVVVATVIVGAGSPGTLMSVELKLGVSPESHEPDRLTCPVHPAMGVRLIA